VTLAARLRAVGARAYATAPRWVPALGVVSAGVLALSVNVLAARTYQRWDFTARSLYTLSAPTLETLHGLSAPVKVVVLLGRGDAFYGSVKQLLTAYAAETRAMDVSYIDPDRDPAAFLAAQQEYGLLAGRSEDGRVVTDAALVIVSGKQRWFVTPDELAEVEPEADRVKPRIEQALTEGLRRVVDPVRARVCVTAGHGEAELYDVSPIGLSELRSRLEKNNYDVVALPAARLSRELQDCRVVAVIAPEQPFAAEAGDALVKFVEQGGSALVLASALVDEDYRPLVTGLEGLARLAGLELGRDTLLERSAEQRVASGMGERFLPVLKDHAITQPLIGDDTRRVLVTVAQSLRPLAEGAAAPLLETSADALSVSDLRPFVEGAADAAELAKKAKTKGPLLVAAARELGQRGSAKSAARLVFVGTSSLATNASFREPALIGNQRFVENALTWLASRPTLVSVPAKEGTTLAVALTEDSLGEVARYVLLYMPSTAVLLGALVLYRRRAKERKSRREAREREER
jgi:hypothetical protein